MLLVVSCFLLFLGHVATGYNPGYQVHLTQKGLNFGSSAGGRAVVKTLESASIPDFTISSKNVAYLSLGNITFEKFGGSDWFYSLQAPNTVTYGLTGASLEIDGDFIGTVRLYVIKNITINGKLRVVASDVTLSLTTEVMVDEKGRPILHASDCKATLGTFRLDIYGTLIAWIIELFHTLIENSIKPQISQMICNAAMEEINVQLRNTIQKLPNPVEIFDGLQIDYGLHQFQIQPNPPSIDFMGNGSIEYQNSVAKLIPPKMNIPADTSTLTDKMGYVWLSDYILESAATVAKENNLLRFVINEKTVPSAASYLKTRCPGLICVGTLLKELATDYPNGTCEVDLESKDIPSVQFSDSGIAFSGTFILTISLFEANEAALTGAFVNISFSAVPEVYPDRINGTFKLAPLKTQQIFSNLKQPIPWSFVEGYGTYLLNEEMSKFLAKGYKFPYLDGVSFDNPAVKMSQHTMEISTDLGYTP